MTDGVQEVTIHLSTSLVDELGGLDKVESEVKRALILDLVRRGRISAGRGAELLNINRYDFLDLMNAHHVELISYSKEDFLYELEGLKKLTHENNRT